MFDASSFLLFLGAALLIAITPGSGILYVAARTLAGGRREGLASSFGTGLGGLVHVFAGAMGLSALVMASAEAFTLLKIIGAAYLIWLGVKTFREGQVDLPVASDSSGMSQAFRDGVLVEALNPKTAAFFLAFLPQFVDPQHNVATQFIVLGLVSVVLNTAVDIVVVFMAWRANSAFQRKPSRIKRMRQGSGLVMCGLGASLLFARRSG